MLQHLRNENDTRAEKEMEIMEEELKDRIEELEGMEDLSLTLIVKECETNEQLQEARKEMINVRASLLFVSDLYKKDICNKTMFP